MVATLETDDLVTARVHARRLDGKLDGLRAADKEQACLAGDPRPRESARPTDAASSPAVDEREVVEALRHHFGQLAEEQAQRLVQSEDLGVACRGRGREK